MKAFPRADGKFNSSIPDEQGMDLRDYFATHAMQGMLINQTIHSATMLLAKQMDMPEENALAKLSYEVANAMMKAREQ